MDEPGGAPEFDIFKRVENLESRLSDSYTLKDALMLGMLGLEYAYLSLATQHPTEADAFKDMIIKKLKSLVGAEKELVISIENDLVAMCNGLAPK